MDKEERGDWIVTLLPEAVSKGGFRLPTEAEWEFAARGGPRQYAYEYAGDDDLSEVAWWYENCELNGVRRTRAVATRAPVEITPKSSLYDMSGNVWEWCWDRYAVEYPRGYVQNPFGPDEGYSRVLRGGSWHDLGIEGCRPAYRSRLDPEFRYDYWGFRLARH